MKDSRYKKMEHLIYDICIVKSNSNKNTLFNDTDSTHTKTINRKRNKGNKRIEVKTKRDKSTTKKTAYLNIHKSRDT